MKKNLKIKILITLLLILTISLMTTYSNAAFANLNTDFFTNLRTSLSRSLTQAITMGKEMLQKIAEGFDIGVEQTENGLKLDLNFDYAGEYITVESDNDGVVQFDMSSMTLTAAGLGETTIHLKIGDKDIPIKVTVNEGGIQLLPQGTGVTVNGLLKAKFDISEKEMANIDAAMQANGGLNNGELSGGVTSTQNITLLQRIKLNLTEAVAGRVNTSGVAGEVAGEVGVNEKPIASGSAGLGYQYGATDPIASVSGSILGNKLLDFQNVTVPISKIISGLKVMLSKLPLPF